MRRRLSCPLLIGRSAELGRLREELARVQAGQPAAVIVAGEAGIGKTRLIDEFLSGVPDSVRVVRSGCVPLADGLLPWSPVVDLLRLLGEPADLPGADQQRVFAAVRGLLDRLSAEAPLVVVLEDLHWADPSTRTLLAYLVHHLANRLLIIGTYRTDELPRAHPLRSLLAELHRNGVPRIELGRLGLAGTTSLVAGLGVEVRPGVAERVHDRCDGNPFLVEELLAAGPEAERLPEGTRDILLHRVRRLPEPDQRLLLAVAVAGRRAGHDLLAEVAGFTELAGLAEDRVRALVDEQILVVDGDGYAFRHALVAEALLAEALPGERTRLHRAYAEALARHQTGDFGDTGWAAASAELAHHWYAAGEPERALLASVEAGLAAERVHGQAEARAHFDRAIALWPTTPKAHSDTGLDLVELCRRGAQAAYLEGDTEHAIALTRRALSEVDLEPVRAGTLYERLGRYLWANGNAEGESIGAYRRAVELVPIEPSAERARALNGLAGAILYADRPGPMVWCLEALDVARLAGARAEEGRALQLIGYCRTMAGEVEAGLDHARRGLAIATELDQSEDLYRAYVNLCGVLRMAGRTAEAAATALDGVEVARRRGADRTYGNFLLGDAIDALILIGRWDEATALLPDRPDAAAHGTAVIATNLWLAAANLHIWCGRYELAQRFLDACLATYATHGHGHVRTMLHVFMAELRLWQGRYAESVHWVRTELDRLGRCEFTTLLSRLVLQGLRVEAELTRPEERDRLTDLLDELAGRPDPPPDAAAIIVLCRAELARARGEIDPERWAEAADEWAKLDLPWPLAYSRWRQAEALLAGRPAAPLRRAGAAALAEAYAVATQLGAEPLREGIAALARRTRLTAALASALAPEPEPEPYGLSPREREVLDLICAGATNRQIAGRLFISEKTVSIHVSRVLTKLGAANRSEAAAIARGHAG